jgi:hypothetical protein
MTAQLLFEKPDDQGFLVEMLLTMKARGQTAAADSDLETMLACLRRGVLTLGNNIPCAQEPILGPQHTIVKDELADGEPASLLMTKEQFVATMSRRIANGSVKAPDAET